MSPRQALRQLLEAEQPPLFEEEVSTAGRRTRPTIDDEKYQKLKGKKRLATYEADLAEWEGGTLTNLPQGSEYAPSSSEGPQGDIFQEQQSMFGLVPQESSGMPAARSPFGESSGEPMTVPASMPPSTQPLSEPRQVSTRSLPESTSSTQRPITPPSREGPPSTFNSPITKSPGGWEVVQQSSDVEELKRRAADLVQPYRDIISQVERDVPGAKLVGARVKADERLFSKMGQRGNDPSIIGDYLGGRMSIDTLEDAEKAIAAIEELGWQRPPWGEFADDNFVWDGDTRGGYRARHLPLVSPDGRLSVEFQLVPKEIADQQKKSHGLYEIIRDESKPAEEREAAATELQELRPPGRDPQADQERDHRPAPFSLLQPHTAQLPAAPLVHPLEVRLHAGLAEVRHPPAQEPV